MDFLFHPRSIALAGITVANPEHWTRTFLEGLIELKFDGQLYLVNPRGGEIQGLKVHKRLEDIPQNIDHVIGLVSARIAPALVRECATKGVRSIHFGTAGFSETGEEEGIKLEAELVETSRSKGIRIIGPNCMGIYCPKSGMSFSPVFPKESGTVGVVSQSGGNANYLIRQAGIRGVRFSKVVSYGNACDLNESDFLEYLTTNTETGIIALYIEGVKDGRRFRQALQEAARKKTVILLKGGSTEGGARAVAGHTASLAGSKVAWDSLCKQFGVISVDSLDELVDVLVTLLFMPDPKGRRVALIGGGGGASVLITDEFERRGLEIPPLPQEIIDEIREFTPIAGNILRNPIDYSQGMLQPENMKKTVDIISRWEGIDFIVKFIRIGQFTQPGDITNHLSRVIEHLSAMVKVRTDSKPMAMVLEPSILPEEEKEIFPIIQKSVSYGLPVYYSFAGAANAINLILNYNENHSGKLSTRR